MDPSGSERTRLWLDHASIAVPDLVAAIAYLDHRLGLAATPSAAAPERHSRVYLDRAYLEVSVRPGGSGWSATNVFLRFDDPDTLRTHLDRAGLVHRFGTYEGVDGTWDDVEVDASDVPLPILVRRTAPPDVAADWPPRLVEPHRCGARTLAQVHIGVPSLEEALEAYRRLLGLDEVRDRRRDARSDRDLAELPTASGSIVLLDRGSGGIERIVLGVTSLEDARMRLGAGLVRPAGDPVAWLDPAEAFGLALGFVEV